jgi:two-component system heavy metal sensor histidine kinase CusS
MNFVRKWSIASRLVILYTLATLTVLGLANGLIYLILDSDLQEQSQRRIGREILLLNSQLRMTDNIPAVTETMATRHAASRNLRHYVRLIGPDGQLLAESPGMDFLIPFNAFPPPQAAEDIENARLLKWRTNGGRRFLLRTAWSEIGPAGTTCTLQLAYDVSPRLLGIDAYQGTVVGIMALALFAAAVAGIDITRRGLRPVREIAAMAGRIGVANLDERLSRHDWPREVNGLAVSFDRMLDRLQNDFVRLSHFTTNMAHEFRTPLNNLIGEAEVAISRERSAEEYKQVILSSLEEYQKLSRLAYRLLFLARLENRGEILTRETYEMHAELTDVLEFYLPMAEEKNISLELRPFDETFLNADPALVHHAIGNLLLNAVKYTGEGGRVTLSVEQKKEGVTVRVNDNGQGIAEADIPHLFDRFYRVESTRQKHPQGTGLGLSIVKSIMELHGGKVKIESQVGVGTTVTLLFPGEPSDSKHPV